MGRGQLSAFLLVESNGIRATSRQRAPSRSSRSSTSGAIVPPGSSHTFTFSLTAPATDGTYTTDWRMLHQGVRWFGDTAARAIQVGCGLDLPDAEVVEAALPTVMDCGGGYEACSVNLKTKIPSKAALSPPDARE
ncbi:MAG: NBR1-Ig-like domain-containing protein [Thermoanaerobaculia bacterium]